MLSVLVISFAVEYFPSNLFLFSFFSISVSVCLPFVLFVFRLAFFFNRTSYRTRSASMGKFHIKCSKLTQLSHSFSRLGCKIWNELPESFRAKPKTSFKKCLQTRLLKFLDQEDIYVDVNTLIKNFKYQWYD